MPVYLIVLALLSVGVVWYLCQTPAELPVLTPFLREATHRPVIDPGHGGEDGGAISVTGVREADINLQIAERTHLLMIFYGIPSVMTRETDISLHDPSAQTLREKKVSDLKNRTAIVNAREDALLISIHQNTFEQEKYSGLQAFYGGEEGSAALAERLQDIVREQLDPKNNRECRRAADSIYLMENVRVPAVLVECGFLTNHNEEARLREATYQKKLAGTILAAFLQWEQIDKEAPGVARQE